MKKLSVIFRIIFILILALLLTMLLCSCDREYNSGKYKEYNGHEISSFEYITTDFNGGSKYYRKFDLTSGKIYNKRVIPMDESFSTDYELFCIIDISKNKEIINTFYSIGLFDLEEEYRTDESIMDGGSWSYIIEYADGTKKVSTGINAGPFELFIESDYAFYDITGEEFFDCVNDSYKIPPTLVVTVDYETETYSSSKSFSISSKKYTWRNKTVNDELFFMNTFDTSLGMNHKATCSNHSYDERFVSAEVYSYVGSVENKKSVDFIIENKSIKFDLTANQNYMIRLEYENGTADYSFNTHITSDD